MSAIFGDTVSFPQDNGPDVDLVVFGDEFYARRESPAGYTAVYSSDLGLYCYAVLQDGEFVPSQAPITEPPPPGVRPHLKESDSVRQRKVAEREMQFEGD